MLWGLYVLTAVRLGSAILTYLLTYSMQQSPSWEANWFAASQEIPAFYGTRRFTTALTSARHLSLSWASPIQSSHPHPTSWRSILILSSHLRLGLPSGLFPSAFPTKILYTPLPTPVRSTCPAHRLLGVLYAEGKGSTVRNVGEMPQRQSPALSMFSIKLYVWQFGLLLTFIKVRTRHYLDTELMHMKRRSW
jgi:hypothetical protein